MKHLQSTAFVLAGSVLIAACADDVFQPQLTPDAPAAMSSDAPGSLDMMATPAPTHMVVFKGKGIPADFAQKVEALGGEVELTVPRFNVASVRGLDDAGILALRSDRNVSLVESETIHELPNVMLGDVLAMGTVPNSPDEPAAADFYPRQWHLKTIQAEDAWDAGHLGSPDVTVAILDTGIDYRHADLAGLVDLDRSVSFATADDPYVAFYFPGAHLVADIGYHGTHVAATVSSNALAAAGVTSRTTLMGVKVCSVAAGGCPAVAIFAGIAHAVENGADIINMSLGGAFQKSANPGYHSIINQAFNYAHQNGVTVIVSAGNESIDLDHDLYPDPNTGEIRHFPSLYKTYCSTPHNICVSATGPTSGGTTGPWPDADAPASYTNYGRSAINVAAPGGTSGAAVWAACSGFSLTVPVCQTGTYVVGLGGTSMAAPHVSGVAAMILGQRGRMQPSQLRNALERAADDLGQSGTDPFYGKGRINAARSIGAI